MAENKKYYWLKLQKDFFKRHDIKIIKSMPNGKDYVIFYLTLLLESIGHEGALRFSDTIPYNDEMLATITDTNIDVVRSAMKILKELNMIEVLEDSTIYMNELNKMLGCETEWAEKKRIYRQNQVQIEDKTRTEKDNVRQEKELELEIELEIDKEKNTEDKPPKLKKIKFGEYHHVVLSDEQYQKLIADYGQDKINEYIKKVDEYCQQYGKSYKDYNLTIRNWLNKDRTGNAPKKEQTHSYDLKEFEKLAMGNVPKFGGK